MKIEINIPNRRVYEILCNAMYQLPWFSMCDCSYEAISAFWYSDANEENRRSNEKPSYEDKIFTYLLASDGHIVKFMDDESCEPAYMNWARIESGTRLMAEQHPVHFADFMLENDDAVTADVWLQCVLLNEVVYG